MARWDRTQAKRQERREARAVAFSDIWIDLCWCPVCADHSFHVELATEAVRNGYVPRCPDCGSRLEVIDRDRGGPLQ